MALTEKQTTLFYLAQAQSCDLKITLRHTEKSPEDDKDYKIDDVFKLLEEKQNMSKGELSGGSTDEGPRKTEDAPRTQVKPVEPVEPPKPVVKKVKVWFANRVIDPGTDITAELLTDSFRQEEIEEGRAGNAMLDFSDTVGLVF